MSERTKVCARCERNLPASMFNHRGDTRDGLQYYCRECNSVALRQHYLANPDRYRSAHYRWKAAHPERAREVFRANNARRQAGIAAHEPLYLAEIPQ